jgi:hypothetical protein
MKRLAKSASLQTSDIGRKASRQMHSRAHALGPLLGKWFIQGIQEIQNQIENGHTVASKVWRTHLKGMKLMMSVVVVDNGELIYIMGFTT